MPDVVVTSERPGGDPPLRGWLLRIGAALVAPRLALRASDSPAGQGRSSSDITLLLLLTIAAVQTDLFFTAGWMLGDGDYSGAITILLVGSREHLIMPIVLLLAGSIVLTIAAGRKRSLARDFDLTCVALTPLVVLELTNALIARAGIDAHRPCVVIGYGWSAVLMVLAWRQSRSRVIDQQASST